MENSRAKWFQLSWLYLKRILILNVAFVVIGTAWRLAFLLSFGNSAELQNLKSDVFKAFVLGMRFDSTVLFYINAIPLLILLFVSPLTALRICEGLCKKIFENFSQFLIPYYTLMLFVVTFLSAGDFGFYSFYQDRINVLVFGLFEDDTVALLKTMWRNYPIIWIFSGLGLFTYLLYKGIRINFTQGKEWLPWRPQKVSALALVCFFFIAFLVNGVGARGSLALFPLSEMDTGISKSIFINHLCFNGTRAFARAVELRSQQSSNWDNNLRHFGYGENYRQAFADFYQLPLEKVPANPLDLMKRQSPANPWAEKNRPHVILLVMESFGSYWTRYDQPEFDLLGNLKKHLQEDTYIPNMLSTTNATIGSLSCLMIGSPQRSISAFLTESTYLQVPFRTSPARVFKENGYKSRFLYGGNPGWREINKFAVMQGFDSVEGENEIAEGLGNGLKEKHDWGIYDQDFFDYILQSLSQATEPQFLLAMTTTNHPPYQLPESYQLADLKIPSELRSRLVGDVSLAEKRFQTYRYSADTLAKFIERIKTSPLKNKVILAVTGDHTFWIANFSEQELLQKGSVPFYLYTPEAIRKKLPNAAFASHSDIAPTLFNLSLSNKSYSTLGRDLFENEGDFAINSANLIIDKTGGVLVTSKPENDGILNWKGDFAELIPGERTPHKEQLAKKYRSLMGILDYYFMIEKKEPASHADTRR